MDKLTKDHLGNIDAAKESALRLLGHSKAFLIITVGQDGAEFHYAYQIFGDTNQLVESCKTAMGADDQIKMFFTRAVVEEATDAK